MTECAACKTAIHSPHLLRLGEEGDCYHESCLLCSQCSLPLTSSCYSSNGLLYCRNDFLRLTIPSCASCGKEFQESDQVRSIRGLTFHLQCFQCSVCSLTLNTGMKFGAGSDGALYCESHFNIVKEEKCETSFSSETDGGSQDEETKAGFPESPEKSELENEEDNEGFYNLVGGVQAVGKVARMVSALASALEILIYVILKNFVDLVIPPQYFNLLQIALYFSFDF